MTEVDPGLKFPQPDNLTPGAPTFLFTPLAHVSLAWKHPGLWQRVLPGLDSYLQMKSGHGHLQQRKRVNAREPSRREGLGRCQLM